jgi:hypothetical protein
MHMGLVPLVVCPLLLLLFLPHLLLGLFGVVV